MNLVLNKKKWSLVMRQEEDKDFLLEWFQEEINSNIDDKVKSEIISDMIDYYLNFIYEQ